MRAVVEELDDHVGAKAIVSALAAAQASRLWIPCGTRTIKIETARNRAVDVLFAVRLQGSQCRVGMGLTIAWTARLWIDGFSRPCRRTRSNPTSSDSGAKKGCACLTGDDANAPAPSTAPRRPNADAPNKVWAVDFQFDATTDGRPIAGVSIVDEDTRECLGGLVERSVTADRLIDVLDRLATVRGYPAMLGCGSGPELACEAMADWAGERVGISFISPGEPGAMATLSRSTAVCATNASKSTSSGP